MLPSSPSRFCLSCGQLEPVGDAEPIWPAGWCCTNCGKLPAVEDGIPMFAPDLADTISGFDPASFAHLAEAEATNFWFVARNVLLTGLISKYFPLATSFLEVGCGNGAVLAEVARRGHWQRLAGSELHPTGLAFAKPRMPPRTELVQMDARNIPAQCVFDVIGAFDVIEHIDEDEGVIRAMRRAVKPSGGVVIAVPQHPSLWSEADTIAHHKRRYVRGELEKKMSSNGFEPIFSTSYTSLLLPLMMLNRRKAQTNAERDEIMREMHLPKLLNSILTTISRIEVTVTLAGMRWPVGGSRVVVARAV